MARIAAILPAGSRITDSVSLGVVAKTFPIDTVRSALSVTGRASIRERDLPAHVMMYYVIALALYMQQCSAREVLRCLLEGIQWLLGPSQTIKVACRSGISQARTRLGWEPVRELHDQVVRPIAVKTTRGAWYRQWRLVSLDGSTLDVADEPANEAAFGRPGSSRGSSAYPQIRFVSLVENGTHVLFGTRMGPCTTSELALAREVLPHLKPGMLCLLDRNFFGFQFWREACDTGADQLWRIKEKARLPCEQRLPDGSYLSHIYPSERDRRHRTNGIVVRVIEYCLEGAADAEPIYRLVTSILDHQQAPAQEEQTGRHADQDQQQNDQQDGQHASSPRSQRLLLRRGTLAPARRASDRPIAIACLRLLTSLTERPLRSLPRFISCIARRTFLPLARLYLRFAMAVSC